MNQATDEQIESLAGKINRSDKRAYDDFFRLLYPQLTGFAITYVRDKSTACDIVQDAFVNLWQKRSGIDPGKSLRSYMYQMVRNRCLNELRNRSKEVVSSELAEKNSNSEMEIENQYYDLNPLGSRFHEWINALPERQKEAFELSRFEGMDHDEIAGLMNISVKTVNNHIVAALTQLRENYRQYKQKNSVSDE
jgi:RNA polymerase sigma-70 factor, ECF subfamily